MKAKLLNPLQLLLVAALAAFSTLPALGQIPTQSYQGHNAEANEVLIKFKQAPASDLQAQADVKADIDQAKAAANIDVARGVGWMLFHSPTNDVGTLMGLLTGAAGVVHVEPNSIVQATRFPYDPNFDLQWDMYNAGQLVPQTIPNTSQQYPFCVGDGVESQMVQGTPGADIGAAQAWDISTGSTANVVGVLDSGIDYSHPDASLNPWSAPRLFYFLQGGTRYACSQGSFGWNVLNRTCDPMDDNGHGTHVAGTIGATGNNGVGIAGINWVTKIVACKFLDSTGNGTTAGAIDCLQFMEGVKATFGGKGGSADIRVLNNSWGCDGTPSQCFSQALLDEINNADAADMLFVAAAGNNGSDNDSTAYYPASYNAPNIVAVASTTNTDGLDWLSNYGQASVQLGAPGDCIWSTVPPNVTLNPSNNLYEYLSGTSMAAPHVAGAADLSLSVCDGDTEWLKPNLLDNARADSALSGKTTTGGVVNAYDSLSAGSSACPGTGYGVLQGAEQSAQISCGPNCWYTIYDAGTVGVEVNGVREAVNYGQGSSAETLAQELANAINNDASFPARAHVSVSGLGGSGNVSLSAKTTGSNTCYAVSTGYTYNSYYFSHPSFTITASGSALVGCK
jgi:serine protease